MTNLNSLSDSRIDNERTRKGSVELKPKSKEEMLEQLKDLRKMLGLHRTDGTMNSTHKFVKKEGSFLDTLDEVKKRESQ